jgi:hypothetical protein
MSNTLFAGELTVFVAEQRGLTRAQRDMINKAFNEGQDLPPRVRFHCAIAEAVNAAIADGIEVGGKIYRPNRNVRAQFGKNKRGLAYLTFGLIAPNGKPLTLTWQGDDNVPYEMVKIAVAHDKGRSVSDATVTLALGNAIVYETGNKGGNKRRKDPRPNHDTGPDGKPYPRPPRRHHNRLCLKDQVSIGARHKNRSTS